MDQLTNLNPLSFQELDKIQKNLELRAHCEQKLRDLQQAGHLTHDELEFILTRFTY